MKPLTLLLNCLLPTTCVFLLSGALATAGVVTRSAVNPANGHTYSLIKANNRVSGVTWTEAEATAVALGGHLVTVNDSTENAWIASRFNDAFYLWMGLSDAVHEGHYVWSSHQPVSYANWYPGEPNNFGGDEDYVNMYTFVPGAQWNDNSNRTSVSGFPFYGLAEFPTTPAITDIPFERLPVSAFGPVNSIGVLNQALIVNVLVHLVGADPGPALMDLWERGVEDVWSNQYDVVDGDNRYPIMLDLAFAPGAGPEVTEVTVVAGDGRPNMLTWYTGNPAGWGYEDQGRVTAHEVGHVLGLYDEYVGGTLHPTDPVIDPTSIMGSPLGMPYERHYTQMLDWINGKTGREMILAQSPFFRSGEPGGPPMEHAPINAVPEPESITIWSVVMLSVALTISWRRRRMASA
jgi:hypothetical protein